TDNNTPLPSNRTRLAAAKVEIGDFRNSGVLSGEAAILHFLHASLPQHTVPVYMGHYQATVNNDDDNDGVVVENKNSNDPSSKELSQKKQNKQNDVATALVMEYLPGQDMHVIRDWATRQYQQLQEQQQGSSSTSRPRRIAVKDAVYLTATVMLPLLQRMHAVGIIHRDVKPSNVVKRAGTASSRDFCVVDFGLSKSVVVPADSSLADAEHAWKGKEWMKSPGMNVSLSKNAPACYRKERSTADFRED
ncbi:MAG: hypothetical protein SGARI_005033, partial [Bacillariaceae sp.]